MSQKTARPGYVSALTPDLGTLSGAVTLDANTCPEYLTANLTGNVTLAVVNGNDFEAINLWLVATGAARTLDKAAGLKVSGDSLIVWPVSLPSGTAARVRLEKHGAKWSVVSFIKNIPTA